jgi:hypothetical protein
MMSKKRETRSRMRWIRSKAFVSHQISTAS